LTDYALVSSALLNKGMSFTDEERDAFHLHGIIPTRVANLEEQRERSYQAFQNKATEIEKYIYLRELQDSNETLFYSLLCENLEEIMPIIYTPTVGEGCQKFSSIYRRPRGLFISYPLKDKMDHILDNHRFDNVEIIVASDGERILGLGDQGAGGMGIPIGKLSVYTACAGIHPRETLPILLDVGTDNPELINDPLYVGWKHERIRGEKYLAFIDQFVEAIKKRFPNVLLQWEDFAKINATSILNRYKEEVCTFNDDIQGTAAVVLAALLAAINISNIPIEEHRILIAGAGSAAIAHSAVKTKYPASEGIVALLEPFIDTVVICTMTALVIIFFNMDGGQFAYGGDGAGNVIMNATGESVGGVNLTTMAFDAVIPHFSIVLTIAIILFAFSTMISWSYYGLQSWKYLFGRGKTADMVYKVLFLIFIVIGAAATLDAVIKFSDAMILALVFPNMIGLLLLFPKVREELKKYLNAIKKK